MVTSLDPSTLRVREFIAHRVPRKQATSPADLAPEYSEAIPTLADSTLEFFTGRMQVMLKAHGRPIAPSAHGASPSPSIIEQYLSSEDNPPDLVEPSKLLAGGLFNAQPGSHWEDESLFVVTRLEIGDAAGLGLMKVERESGVNLEQTTVDGKTVFEVKVYEDLHLTDSTRFYKAAAFWIESDKLVGFLADDQQGTGRAAAYFISSFLGTEYQRTDEVDTRDFYNSVTRFISAEMKGEAKLDAYDALQVEVRSNKATINPMSFLKDHFDPDVRNVLKKHLEEDGVRMTSFAKDVGALGRGPRQSKLRTERGLRIWGSPDELRDLVEVKVIDDEKVIVIRDTISDVAK